MRVLDVIKWPFRVIAEQYAVHRRLSHFTCGDCERNEQCGMPPSEACVARQAQIARYGDRPRSARAALY